MIPRVWEDSKMQGLVQTGPPPGAEIVQYKVSRSFKVPRLTALREFKTDNQHEKTLVILLGEVDPYDGLLQGIYDYVPEGYQNAQADDGASWIIVNDGKSAWRKLT